MFEVGGVARGETGWSEAIAHYRWARCRGVVGCPRRCITAANNPKQPSLGILVRSMLAPVGEVRSQRMFGGYGLYVDDVFVAIIAPQTSGSVFVAAQPLAGSRPMSDQGATLLGS